MNVYINIITTYSYVANYTVQTWQGNEACGLKNASLAKCYYQDRDLERPANFVQSILLSSLVFLGTQMVKNRAFCPSRGLSVD